MKQNDFGKTFTNGREMKYSSEMIRKYEAPEYRKAAEEYERKAIRERRIRNEDPEGYLRSKDEKKRFEEDGVRTVKNIKGKKKKHGKRKIFRNVIIFIIILLAVFLAYFFIITSRFDKVTTDEDQFAINIQSADSLRGYRNIAVLGTDSRRGEGYDGSRTDAIIIISIKKSSGDINMISVMRDSYLKLADADSSLKLDKITHAHHYGGGADTCAALNRSLDLNIKEFMIFNWEAVSDAVDTLGGIEIDVKPNELRDMNKWGPETAENTGGKYTRVKHPGKQMFDGVQATTYCRIRKTSGGDKGRGERYKKVTSAVMLKAISSPVKLNALSRKVFPKIRTNMTQLQFLTAAVRAPGYDIKKNLSWPKNYYGGLLSGRWYAVPRTLVWNVSWLHKKAFAQPGYVPSSKCRSISDEIINTTGIQ